MCSNTLMQTGTHRGKHRPQVEHNYIIHPFKVLKEDRSCNYKRNSAITLQFIADALVNHLI